MSSGEISGSFTHVFNDPAMYEKLQSRETRHTLTVKRSVVWWKRPWCWLRRKPTSWEQTFKDVVFDELYVEDDEGNVTLRFATCRDA